MMVLDKESEYFKLKMEIFILGIGKMIFIMAMECIFTHKERDIRVSWLKDSNRVRGSIFIKMEEFTKVNGKMIKEKVREFKRIH